MDTCKKKPFFPATCPIPGAFVRISLVLPLTFFVDQRADADVVLDGRLTDMKRVEIAGPEFNIEQAFGKTRGSNLFHSFESFSLNRNEAAVFKGGGVSNVLARVTGEKASIITGQIRSEIAGADLFLMNPKGIVFGRDSSIDVAGAFTATTADYIKLADGTFFSAAPGAADLTLTSAAPEAFGFLDPSSNSNSGGNAAISLDGVEWELEQKHIGAVAREIFVEGSGIYNRGGSVELTAVGSGASEVPASIDVGTPFSSDGILSVLDSDVSVSEESNGRISLRGGNVIITGTGFEERGLEANASGEAAGGSISIEATTLKLRDHARVQTSSVNGQPGGEITIRAEGAVTMDSGSQVIASSFQVGNGGSIDIEAGSMDINGHSAEGATRLSAQSNSGASGRAGDISVSLQGKLTLSNGGSIETNTFSAGDGGNISLVAGGLDISAGTHQFPIGISSSVAPGASGNGGNVTVGVAGNVDIRDNGWIALLSLSDGDAGNLDLRARRLAITGASDESRRNAFLTGLVGITTGGQGGDLGVNANEIHLHSGGHIDSSSFPGGGNGGNIHVTAGSIFADRAGSDFFTGIGTDTESTGRAGGVRVNAKRIELLNGANISSSTFGPGNAGDLAVAGDQIRISGSGPDSVHVPTTSSGILALSRADATGSTGTIAVQGRNIEVASGGTISAQEFGNGTGGDVAIVANEGIVTVRRGGSISAQAAGSGSAGSVDLRAREVVIAERGIVESRNAGSGDAGEVSIAAARETRLQGGTVSVAADGGNAGTVSIDAGQRLISSQGVITAQAGGNGGNIVVRAGRLIDLDSSRLEAAADGNGGNVTVEDAEFFLINNSILTANAVQGDGGRIDVSTGVFLNNLSQVTASSDFGADGVVRIDTDFAAEGQEADREERVLNASDALQEECTKQIPSESGSFIRAGRGGTTRLPGGYLPSFRLIAVE